MLEYMSHDEFSQSVYSLGGARVFPSRIGTSKSARPPRSFRWAVMFTSGTSRRARWFPDVLRRKPAARADSRHRVNGKADFTGLTGDRMELGVFFDKSWRSWIFGVHACAESQRQRRPGIRNAFDPTGLGGALRVVAGLGTDGQCRAAPHRAPRAIRDTARLGRQPGDIAARRHALAVEADTAIRAAGARTQLIAGRGL